LATGGWSVLLEGKKLGMLTMTIKTKVGEVHPKNDIKLLEFTNIKIKRSGIDQLRSWNSDTVRNSWASLGGYHFMC
jgi:hypothetical protein